MAKRLLQTEPVFDKLPPADSSQPKRSLPPFLEEAQ